MKKNYIKLILFFTSFNWFISFSRSALLPHFVKEGMTLQQIIFGALLTFVGVILALILISPISRRLKARTSWIMAIILSYVYILLLIKINSPFQLYLAYFINGLITFFFYIFYNSAHFESTAKKHIGKSSALMFSIGPAISVIAPLLAGYLAQIDYFYIWIFSFLFFFVPLYLVRFQKNFSVGYSIKEIVYEIKATRIFIFLGAFWEAMVFGVIPVYTLFFIKSPLGYGSFLAYLGLMGILANLFLGTLSDKIKKRIVFLYPITFSMAAVTFLFPLAVSNIFIWITLSGAVQFIYPLYNNVSLAMVIDSHSDIKRAVVGREMMLSLGRISGLALAFLSFFFEKQPCCIFLVLGLSMVIFPAVLFWRTKLAKSYSYL